MGNNIRKEISYVNMFLQDFGGFVLCKIAAMTLNCPMSVLYRKKTILFLIVIKIKSNVNMICFHIDIIWEHFVNMENCNDIVCIELTDHEIKLYTGKHYAF